MSLTYYLGANTPDGFLSHFAGMTESVSRLYIIKGGPGCGKSTAMKRIAEYCEEAGMTVERIRCSSDPESLDGVRILEPDVLYVDGTAPHVVEPRCPGARDGILDFGAFWDEDQLTGKRQEIEKTSAAVSACYARTYRYLRAVGELAAAAVSDAVRTADRERLLRRARRIAERYIPARRGRPRGRKFDIYLSTLTPEGPTFLDCFSSWEVCELQDGRILSPLVTEPVLEAALASGYTVYAASDPLLPAAGPRHLLVPALRFALLSSGGTFGCRPTGRRRVRLDRLTDPDGGRDVLRRKRDEVCAERLLAGAAECLGEAKEHHDRLEALYRPAVDFRRVDELTRRHCEMLRERFRSVNGSSDQA